MAVGALWGFWGPSGVSVGNGIYGVYGLGLGLCSLKLGLVGLRVMLRL